MTNSGNSSNATCICQQGNGSESLLRWEGFDCSQKVYNIEKPINILTIANVTNVLFKGPEIWTAIVPPITVLVAMMTVIVSRLYTAYKNATDR